MRHELPPLPYEKDALEPHISRETLEYHHGKHHAKYVNTLNDLIKGTEFEKQSLEQIVMNSSGAIFNNAGQTWNHTFYWNCMSPDGGGSPSGNLTDAIKSSFQSLDGFKDEFTNQAAKLFGSGWCWLVKDDNGSLSIETTANGDTPLTEGKTPLLTCDVWEHAYYIDYRNARPEYLEAFWKIINWAFVAENFDSTPEQVQRIAASR